MAPSKKSKSVNKRFNNEASPETGVGRSSKTKQRKKKLTDKLGPQWTSRELERFYDAYRKHRGDWKKVAASVRNNRSVDMVESLFHMNRAYLSLPEGFASVAGLIAMMTDHYSVIEGSESEGEGHGASGVQRKHQKHKHAKVRHSDFREEVIHSYSVASEEGCLPFLRQTQIHEKERRAARKRTPRFPVPSTYDTDYREGYTPPNKRAKIQREDDDGDSHVVGLTFADELNGRTVISRLGKKSQAKEAQSKHYDTTLFENGLRTGRDRRHIKGAPVRDGALLMNVEKAEGNDSDDSGESRDLFDGLQALSELAASMLPSGLMESESFAHSNEDRKPNDVDERSNIHEAIPTIHLREKAKQEEISAAIKRKPNSAAEESVDGKTVSIVELNTSRRKRKQKVIGVEGSKDSIQNKSLYNKESMAEDDTLKTIVKARRNNSRGSPTKQPKTAKILEECGSTSDKKETEHEEATQVLGSDPESLPRRPINRRKMSLKKSLQGRAKSPSAIITHDDKLHCNEVFSEHDSLKDKVSTCLSYLSIRRWCIYEWFYSAIDYPWFANMEFTDYLNHVGLGHVPRLARLEWSVIKSSLGRPRRFSERFIQEERHKLKQYRESVRKHYTDLRDGSREDLPTDLAQPLSVGNRVIAIHPKTREIRDGKILTVDHNKCKVLFDEFGVDSVMDIDCMPLNPMEYMPESLRRQIDKCLSVSKEPHLNRHSNSVASVLSAPSAKQDNINGVILHDKVLTTNTSDQYTTNNTKARGTVMMQQNTSDLQELEEDMIEIFSGSKSKAQAMVDAIMKASSAKKDDMVQQALNSISEQHQPLSNSIMSIIKHQDHTNGRFDLHHDQSLSLSNKAEPLMSNGLVSRDGSGKNETQTQTLSELITSCAAVWLMIQMCTERQYPPADVAQLMDKAMSELQPRCPQNMTLYREIQTCMGLIKTQIMSLVRT